MLAGCPLSSAAPSGGHCANISLGALITCYDRKVSLMLLPPGEWILLIANHISQHNHYYLKHASRPMVRYTPAALPRWPFPEHDSSTENLA